MFVNYLGSTQCLHCKTEFDFGSGYFQKKCKRCRKEIDLCPSCNSSYTSIKCPNCKGRLEKTTFEKDYEEGRVLF